MTELYEKSLQKLELSAVLEQLADCAHSEAGKDRCRKLLIRKIFGVFTRRKLLHSNINRVRAGIQRSWQALRSSARS